MSVLMRREALVSGLGKESCRATSHTYCTSCSVLSCHERDGFALRGERKKGKRETPKLSTEQLRSENLRGRTLTLSHTLVSIDCCPGGEGGAVKR